MKKLILSTLVTTTLLVGLFSCATSYDRSRYKEWENAGKAIAITLDAPIPDWNYRIYNDSIRKVIDAYQVDSTVYIIYNVVTCSTVVDEDDPELEPGIHPSESYNDTIELSIDRAEHYALTGANQDTVLNLIRYELLAIDDLKWHGDSKKVKGPENYDKVRLLIGDDDENLYIYHRVNGKLIYAVTDLSSLVKKVYSVTYSDNLEEAFNQFKKLRPKLFLALFTNNIVKGSSAEFGDNFIAAGWELTNQYFYSPSKLNGALVRWISNNSNFVENGSNIDIIYGETKISSIPKAAFGH
jgi:hypothetical protein